MRLGDALQRKVDCWYNDVFYLASLTLLCLRVRKYGSFEDLPLYYDILCLLRGLLHRPYLCYSKCDRRCIHCYMYIVYRHTVMILSFRTYMPGQTVQTQIRLLLEEQSDQGLHCLPFRLHRLDSLLCGRATLFKFSSDYNKCFGCPNI